MKRVTTKFEYHDSNLVAADWMDERELRLTFQLDTSSAVVAMTFHEVSNRDEVAAALSEVGSKMSHDRWLADVAGIGRTESGYVIDTSQGELLIKARAFTE